MVPPVSVQIDIATIIDHTYLRADCTVADVKVLCKEALEYGFHSVCIPPYHIFQAKKILGESSVRVSTVVGYPMGYSTAGAKVEEVKRACIDGADELDVMINVAAVKNNDWNTVKNDIDSATMISHLKGKRIKLIVEIGLMQSDELKKICELAVNAGVDFIKTSTDFNSYLVTPGDIAMLRGLLPKGIKINASGRICTLDDALALINAGADRIGTTSGVRIVTMQ